MAALLFYRPPATSGALVFGDEDGPAPDVPPNPAQVAFTLRGPTVRAVARYVSGTQRPVATEVQARFQDGGPLAIAVAGRWQDSGRQQAAQDMRWQDAQALHAPAAIGWRDARRERDDTAARFQDGQRLRDDTLAGFQEAIRMGLETAGRYRQAIKTRSVTLTRYEDALRGLAGLQQIRFQDAVAVSFQILARSRDGRALARAWASRFQDAGPPLPGVSGLLPPDPPLPPVPCYLPHPALLFDRPPAESAALVFACPGDVDPLPPVGLVIVPVLRTYTVINSASLRRVDGDVAIPMIGATLDLDYESWTYRFSARLPVSALPLVERGALGEPVEAVLRVNGTAFRVILEGVQMERTFGRASVSVSGRGRSAILDAPYVPAQVFGNPGAARTAQQLARDVLTFNGVPIGWDVDAGWMPEDWQIPAGLWSHQGTYITALSAIASAAGAYLQPHRVNAALRVLLRYPRPSWEWSQVVPDFELPADLVEREGITWTDKPLFNRVYVRGQQAPGIMGVVTRSGTAGDIEAPQVVDPLMTTATAVRQRAVPVLSDVGRQAEVTLRLPVLAQTGVIEPGAFVRYVDGPTTRVGLVRSNTTSIERGDDTLQVWQSIGVETHVTV